MSVLRDEDAARVGYRYLSRVYDYVRPLFVGAAATRERYFEHLPVEPSDRVLELGCGTGICTKRLAEAAETVDGIDISGRQLEYASRKDGLEDVHFVRGDAQHLPYEDGSFDAVVSVGTLPYVPEPVTMLQEARRVVGADGRLFVVGPKRPAGPVRRRIAEALFFVYTAEDARQMCERAGWTDVENHEVHMDWLGRDALVTVAKTD